MVEKGRLKVAAIGTGSLGRHHARNYAELAAEGRVELLGFCDVDPKTVADLAVAHGTRSFTNWQELLGKVDAVSIATPTETHCDIACAFLESGTHVLVEKPI